MSCLLPPPRASLVPSDLTPMERAWHAQAFAAVPERTEKQPARAMRAAERLRGHLITRRTLGHGFGPREPEITRAVWA